MTRATVETASRPVVELVTVTIPSEIGELLIVTDARAVCALDFADTEERMMALLSRHFDRFVLRRARDPLGVRGKLEAYLAGDLRALDGIDVNPGGTPFQQTVWRALREIPAGTTRSYAELAAGIHHHGAARAVGHANSLNPVAIVIPCHRLVGSDEAFTGYAGGLERKRWLLRHEGALPG
jgi:methylated-DNA-[protein]-cysteine S-methyltransferase